MRNAFICLLVLLYVKQSLCAQTTTGQLVWQAKEIKMPAGQQKKDVKISNTFTSGLPLSLHPLAPSIKNSPSNFPAFPCNYYNSNLGWVCTQEWKLEKKTSLPLRFRLGSKEQVDWLEGKNYHH